MLNLQSKQPRSASPVLLGCAGFETPARWYSGRPEVTQAVTQICLWTILKTYTSMDLFNEFDYQGIRSENLIFKIVCRRIRYLKQRIKNVSPKTSETYPVQIDPGFRAASRRFRPSIS